MTCQTRHYRLVCHPRGPARVFAQKQSAHSQIVRETPSGFYSVNTLLRTEQDNIIEPFSVWQPNAGAVRYTQYFAHSIRLQP